MRLKAEDLRKEVSISLQGEEPWLDNIYQSFSIDKSVGPHLTGTITIQPEPYDVFRVSGSLSFQPLVNCSRCEDLIPWPIEVQVKGRFLKRYEELMEDEEVELEPEDLDDYYIDQEGSLNLEILVNDLIQTAIPQRRVLQSDDGQSCRLCHKDLTTRIVHQAEMPEAANPFAVLKNLKFPKKDS